MTNRDRPPYTGAEALERLKAGVEANVRHTVRELHQTPEATARLPSGHMRLVGAVYDLESGRVRFLE